MDQFAVVANFLSAALVSGLFGTLVMTLFLWSVARWVTWPVSPLIAVGSVITRSYDFARTFGMALHLASGMIFGLLYVFAFRLFGHEQLIFFIITGTGLGAAHGFVLFYMLIPLLAEHHPLRAVRDYGPGISAILFIAHIIYGASVGLCAGLLLS